MAGDAVPVNLSLAAQLSASNNAQMETGAITVSGPVIQYGSGSVASGAPASYTALFIGVAVVVVLAFLAWAFKRKKG